MSIISEIKLFWQCVVECHVEDKLARAKRKCQHKGTEQKVLVSIRRRKLEDNDPMFIILTQTIECQFCGTTFCETASHFHLAADLKLLGLSPIKYIEEVNS